MVLEGAWGLVHAGAYFQGGWSEFVGHGPNCGIEPEALRLDGPASCSAVEWDVVGLRYSFVAPPPRLLLHSNLADTLNHSVDRPRLRRTPLLVRLAPLQNESHHLVEQ